MSSVSKPRVRHNRHKQGLNLTLEKLSADFRDYKEELDNLRKLHSIHQELLSILQNELSVATMDNERYRTLYAQSRKDFENVVSEYEFKQKSLFKELEELKLETISQRNRINALNSNGTTLEWIENSRKFAETPIFKRIMYAANHPLEPVLESEWQELAVAFSSHFPTLYHDITHQLDKTGQLKFKVCILTAMGLRNGEQACLLDKSKQTITNTMSALNKMLFGNSSSRTLFKNLVERYNIFL